MRLMFNSGIDQKRFRYFKSEQKAVALYKKITASPATATYEQVGEDFGGGDDIASLWKVSVNI